MPSKDVSYVNPGWSLHVFPASEGKHAALACFVVWNNLFEHRSEKVVTK